MSTSVSAQGFPRLGSTYEGNVKLFRTGAEHMMHSFVILVVVDVEDDTEDIGLGRL